MIRYRDRKVDRTVFGGSKEPSISELADALDAANAEIATLRRDASNKDCHICHHDSVAQLICSACPPTCVYCERNTLRQRVRELEGALDRARLTMTDMRIFLDMIGRLQMAQAASIAIADAERALSGKPQSDGV